MPHVSRRKLDPRVEKELYTLLDYTLGHLKPDEAQKLLEALLSQTEKLMLGKRIAAILLLDDGLPQAHIAETIKLTPETISKLSLLLETPRGQGFKVVIDKARNLQRTRLFKKILLDVLSKAIRAAGGRV